MKLFMVVDKVDEWMTSMNSRNYLEAQNSTTVSVMFIPSCHHTSTALSPGKRKAPAKRVLQVVKLPEKPVTDKKKAAALRRVFSRKTKTRPVRCLPHFQYWRHQAYVIWGGDWESWTQISEPWLTPWTLSLLRECLCCYTCLVSQLSRSQCQLYKVWSNKQSFICDVFIERHQIAYNGGFHEGFLHWKFPESSSRFWKDLENF